MDKRFTILMIMLNVVGAITWPSYWQYFFLGGIFAFSISLFVNKF